jgi:hypothetical protein
MGMAQVTVPGTQVGKRAVVQLVAQVLVTETVLTVGILAAVLLTAPEAQATVPVMEQIPDPGTQVVIQEAAQLVAQVLVMETVLMVVLVLVMVLEALEGHLMVLDQD